MWLRLTSFPNVHGRTARQTEPEPRHRRSLNAFPGQTAGNTATLQDADELRVPGRSTLSRPPSLAESRMSRVGRSSDFRVRFVRPSRRPAGEFASLSYATMARRSDEPSNTRLQRRGPSRNCTGFPVRRPSHRNGRPPTHQAESVNLSNGVKTVNRRLSGNPDAELGTGPN